MTPPRAASLQAGALNLTIVVTCFLTKYLAGNLSALKFGKNIAYVHDLFSAIGVLLMNTVGVLQLLNFRRNIFV